MSFVEELKRRKVFRTAAAYLATVFVALQVADLIFEPLGFSSDAYRILIIACGAGFPVALLLSWLFDLRSESEVTTTPRRQQVVTLILIVVATTLLAGLAIARWRESEAQVRVIPSSPSKDAARIRLDEKTYSDYIRAKTLMRRVNQQDQDSAVRLLERVVERYPDFSGAHGELALAYVYQYARMRAGNPDLEQKALLAAERALELDARNADAHVVRGRMLWTPSGGYPHEQVAEEYGHALQLNPAHTEALFQMGQLFMHVGLLDEALDLFQQSARVAPLDPRPRVATGQARAYRLENEEAVALLRTTPAAHDVSMTGAQIALALSRLGRGSEADATVRRYAERMDDDAGVLASAHAVLLAKKEKADSARIMVQKAAAQNQTSILFHHTAYNIGVTYAVLNRPDSAMLWLTRAADEGFPCYPLFKRDPDLRTLRERREFQALLEDLERRHERFRKFRLGKSGSVVH